MQINTKADIRAETELAIAAFLAKGNVITQIKARKAPRVKTANGKAKGHFGTKPVFASGV